MTFARQPRHTDKARTRDDQRAQLATFLSLATDKAFAGLTLDTLAMRHPKVPAAEVARAFTEAQERRAARA